MSQNPEHTPAKELPQNTSAPQTAQPYNFGKVLDCVLIPRTVASDTSLLPGARLLWGVIRRLGFKSGQCFASERRLGEEIGVCERHLRRYCAQLVKAGLLKETLIPGKRVRRELLWHERFNSELPEELNTNGGCSNERRNTLRPLFQEGGWTSKSGEGGPASPGGQDMEVHPILRGVLEASLEKPLPLTPSPEKGSVKQPTTSASGEGEPCTTSARPTSLTGGRAPRKPRARRRHDRAGYDQSLEQPSDDAPGESYNERIRTLCFWYTHEMHAEPPIATLDAVDRILRARQVNSTDYVLLVQRELRKLQGEKSEQIWMQTALKLKPRKGDGTSAP